MFPYGARHKTPQEIVEQSWELVWDSFREVGDYMRGAMHTLDDEIMAKRAADESPGQ